MSQSHPTTMSRALDIIVFGATGFTGQYVIPILANLTKTKNRSISWGIAGRSEKKLVDLLAQTERETGLFLRNIPIIIADIQNKTSLKEMVRKTNVIINCCGPYRFFGEAVVSACVEEGTHHVDVSGEPQYMEEMQFKYNEKAREKGVYIISACGFDSLPTDLGVVFLEKKFEGTLNSVVTYLESWDEEHNVDGVESPKFNFATWESAVYGLKHAKDLAKLRKELFSERLPSFKPKVQVANRIHRTTYAEGWAVPLPTADRSVVKRSQRLFYFRDSKRPIQVETFHMFKSLYNVVGLMVFGATFQTFVKYQKGRELLLKHPDKFSGGVFSRDPPKKEKLQNQQFILHMYGEGWKERLPNVNDELSIPPNRAIYVKIRGSDPAYGGAALCVALSAITIITESEKMPKDGGVYPPGYAFAETSLVEELSENGMVFEVEGRKDLPTSKY